MCRWIWYEFSECDWNFVRGRWKRREVLLGKVATPAPAYPPWILGLKIDHFLLWCEKFGVLAREGWKIRWCMLVDGPDMSGWVTIRVYVENESPSFASLPPGFVCFSGFYVKGV